MFTSIGPLLDRVLRRLYAACAVLAGFAIIVIALSVCVSIVSRALNIYVSGTTEIAGYGMAAAGALGLAHTAMSGGHVRVDLVLSRLREKPRHWMELLAMAVSTLIVGFTAWTLYGMVATSHRFGDLSSNSDGLPLWIPQLPLAVGFVVFALSLAHLTILRLLGCAAGSEPGGQAA